MGPIRIVQRFFDNRLLYSLKSKLILSFLAISIIPLIGVGSLAFFQFQEALRTQTSNELTVMRNLKIEQVKTYLRQIEQDIKLVAELPNVKTAVQQLEISVRGQGLNQVRQMGFLGRPDLFYLQAYNPYAVYHAKYHAFFRELVQTKGYADIWLVSPEGDIIYTYAKRNDFATNLFKVPYQDILPNQFFQNLLGHAQTGQVKITDFVSYPPAGDIPVGFFGAPILDDDKILGVLIYEVPLDQINDLMQVNTGFWKTGETYLVGEDKLSRTKTRFGEEINFFKQKVDTLAVQKGVLGESGVAIIKDYRGVPVLSAYQALELNGFKWVLLAEVDKSEAFGPSNRLGSLMAGIIVITTIVVMGVGLYIGRGIAKPIVELAETSTRIASGDLELRARSGTRDEIGHLAEAFNSMTDQLSELIGSLEQQIAERKQIEQALRESEDRYRGLFENSPISLWEEDFSGVKTIFDDLKKQGVADIETYFDRHPETVQHCAEMIRIDDVNQATLVLHAASKKEELLAGLVKTFTPESFDAFRRELVCLWNGETKMTEDAVVKTLAGERRNVTVCFSVCPGHEETLSKVLVSILDITERKKVEEALRQLNIELDRRVLNRTAQLEAANKELEGFVYSISHDLRAPLRHIDGFIELLKQKVGTNFNEQGRHYMACISDAAQKMGRLIEDLLSFSQMGRQAISLQQVALGTLVRDVIQILEADSAGRNIDWFIGELPVVEGDAAMLRIVLDNLIANALKFTRPLAQVEIEIGWLGEQETETVIFIRDNGVGFDMNYADKLFNVFQRLHRVDEFEGTGIGLANVRRIIARHGGRTWAKGELNQGATFYFSLPKI